jgi:hypothetical protein
MVMESNMFKERVLKYKEENKLKPCFFFSLLLSFFYYLFSLRAKNKEEDEYGYISLCLLSIFALWVVFIWKKLSQAEEKKKA